MKKIISLILALMLIFSISVTAFAAGTNTITVTSARPGEVYKLYKMMDLTVGENNGKESYSYTTTSEWESFFKNEGDSYVTITNGYVTDIQQTADFAQAAAKFAEKLSPLSTVTCDADSTSVEFNNLDSGYYLVTSSLGTVAMTASTPSTPSKTVIEKNRTDTITKTVQEDSKMTYGSENDAQIGDTIYYKSVVTLVKNTTNVTIVDTMGPGLTYNYDVVFSDGITSDDYTCTETDNGFEIKILDTYTEALTGDVTLMLTYTAILNTKADVKNPEINKIVVKYGNAQSVEAQTKTSTHKLTVTKFAQDIDNLAGAVFKLKKGGTVLNLVKIDATTYRIADKTDTDTVDTFTTVATGPITINGLDSDNDYTLEEITAPVGYNKLAEEVKVLVNQDDNSLYANVENKSGTELPTTGGIGTTIFYVLGATMVFGAAVLLVTKKRMSVSK